MTQWEYRTESSPDYVTGSYLNVFGGDGWELVAVVSRPGLPERAIFKRPIVTSGRLTAKKGAK